MDDQWMEWALRPTFKDFLTAKMNHRRFLNCRLKIVKYLHNPNIYQCFINKLMYLGFMFSCAGGRLSR